MLTSKRVHSWAGFVLTTILIPTGFAVAIGTVEAFLIVCLICLSAWVLSHDGVRPRTEAWSQRLAGWHKEKPMFSFTAITLCGALFGAALFSGALAFGIWQMNRSASNPNHGARGNSTAYPVLPVPSTVGKQGDGASPVQPTLEATKKYANAKTAEDKAPSITQGAGSIAQVGDHNTATINNPPFDPNTPVVSYDFNGMKRTTSRGIMKGETGHEANYVQKMWALVEQDDAVKMLQESEAEIQRGNKAFFTPRYFEALAHVGLRNRKTALAKLATLIADAPSGSEVQELAITLKKRISPKPLRLSDSQLQAVREAMRPYVTLVVKIYLVDPDQPATQFGARLYSALDEAHVNPDLHSIVAAQAPIGVPWGLSVVAGTDRIAERDALARVLEEQGVIDGKLMTGQSKNLNDFSIYIVPVD